MLIRLATGDDAGRVARLYELVHSAEEAGRLSTGWIRGVYPLPATAWEAQARGDLFVLEQEGELKGAGIINRIQHESYKFADWQHDPGSDDKVMVLHTLAIAPDSAGQGLGRAFLRFYADHALANGCPVLRLDTNAVNQAARRFYEKAGFRQAGIVKTSFNGIHDVELVLLENLAENVRQG